MRFGLRAWGSGAVLSVSLASLLTLSACGNSSSNAGAPPPASGGASQSQGGSVSPASGGSAMPGSGGAASTGGVAPASGGNGAQSGGAVSAGGSVSTGGSAGGAPAATNDCPPAPPGLVTFSVPSGTFEGSLSVALSTTQAGAEIRYTTDRTAPTASSPLYAGTPIAVSTTTEVMAQAFVQGAPVGQAGAGVYVARGFDQMHDLPVIVLDSFGTALSTSGSGGRPSGIGAVNKDYVNAALLTFEPSSGMTSLAAAPAVSTPAAFHVRGQSSASYDKKPYRLELRKVDGTDRNCPMLGMPRESDWVLHAPFPDKALIRNAFVYSLGKDMGLAAPRAMFAEVYLNTAARPLQSSDYQGVYLLVETIKNQKDRLNLQQLKETDTALPAIAGGYVFKFEWQVADIEQKLVCPSGQQNCWDWLEVDDPKPWNQQQQGYLAGFLGSFVTGLHSANPTDPTTGYPAFMDSPSFVNQVIMHELTRNLDAYSRSQFFYKDREGKITAGPLWDYDLIAGVGSSGNYANLSQSGWQYESNASRLRVTADWFPVLLANPTFKAELIARWKELRAGLLSDAEVTARITRLTTGLASGAQRNFQKWNNLTTMRIGFFDTPTAATWEGQVNAMRDWLLGRMKWLDTSWQ
ncbi:MAG TPA: CotH kinase family protein [Polyangiaceae bacterium]|nr:CotH kinase family protein [Polyangiaceae bacterium]